MQHRIQDGFQTAAEGLQLRIAGLRFCQNMDREPNKARADTSVTPRKERKGQSAEIQLS